MAADLAHQVGWRSLSANLKARQRMVDEALVQEQGLEMPLAHHEVARDGMQEHSCPRKCAHAMTCSCWGLQHPRLELRSIFVEGTCYKLTHNFTRPHSAERALLTQQ
jgi:hypothetical protein